MVLILILPLQVSCRSDQSDSTCEAARLNIDLSKPGNRPSAAIYFSNVDVFQVDLISKALVVVAAAAAV